MLIVVGILIALQISEWNEEKKLRIEEIGLLKKLESELKIQVEESQRIYSFNTDFLNLGIRFMESHLKHQDAGFDIEDYVRLGDFYPVNIHINSLEVALQGDKISLIRSDSLVDSLRQLKANLVILEDDSKYLDESWQSEIKPFFIESGLAIERFKKHFEFKTNPDPAVLDRIDNEVLANNLVFQLGVQREWTNMQKIILEDMRDILRKVQEELED